MLTRLAEERFSILEEITSGLSHALTTRHKKCPLSRFSLMLSTTKTNGNRRLMSPSIDEVKTAWSIVATFLTPPQTQEEYEGLQARLDQLEEEIEEGSHPETLLDYLGDLLDQYEMNHFHEVAELNKEYVAPSEVLRRFMGRHGLKQNDLAPLFGTQSRVSEILNGKRQITLSQVKKLHQKYQIPVDLFF